MKVVARSTLWLLPLLVALGSSVARADEAACIAASESALTLRQQGKLHAAREQLAICSDPSCSTELRQDCSQRVAAVNSAMPTVIFAAKDGAGNDLFAVTVTLDGAPLSSVLDGRPIAVDPGVHAFHFETPGAPPQDKQLVVREGEHDRPVSVVLGAPVTTTTTTTLMTAPPIRPSTWSTRKTLALVTGGVGLVGIGLGAVFGALALGDKNKQNDNCGTPATCTSFGQANEDYRVAGLNATGATVGFIAGGLLVAGGAVLWFTAPKPPPSSGSTSTPPRGRFLGLAPWFDGRAPGLAFTGEL